MSGLLGCGGWEEVGSEALELFFSMLDVGGRERISQRKGRTSELRSSHNSQRRDSSSFLPLPSLLHSYLPSPYPTLFSSLTHLSSCLLVLEISSFLSRPSQAPRQQKSSRPGQSSSRPSMPPSTWLFSRTRLVLDSRHGRQRAEGRSLEVLQLSGQSQDL